MTYGSLRTPMPVTDTFNNFPWLMEETTDPTKSQLLKFNKGDFIYLPNDYSNKIYVIIEGKVKVGAYSEDGKEIIRDIAYKDEVFGEMCLIHQDHRKEFAQAALDSEVLSIPLQSLESYLTRHPNFYKLVTMTLARKLQSAHKRLERQVFKNAKSRIIQFLCDLGETKGQRVGYETLVKDFYTHREVASLTGTSRQTVTTILNELRAANKIYFDRKRLLIRDLTELKSLID